MSHEDTRPFLLGLSFPGFHVLQRGWLPLTMFPAGDRLPKEQRMTLRNWIHLLIAALLILAMSSSGITAPVATVEELVAAGTGASHDAQRSRHWQDDHHSSRWLTSVNEVAADSDAYLNRLADKAPGFTISDMTLRGPRSNSDSDRDQLSGKCATGFELHGKTVGRRFRRRVQRAETRLSSLAKK